MSDFDAARKRLGGIVEDPLLLHVAEPHRVVADIRLLLAEVEQLKELERASFRAWEKAEAEVERLREALRDQAHGSGSWEEERDRIEAAREALRPAAPECHCTGDGHRRDCAFWISLAPDPTPSEEPIEKA